MKKLFPIATNLQTQYHLKLWGEWVIKYNGLFWDNGHRGQCSPYTPCYHNLYIRITIFLPRNNTQSTGYN